MFVYIGLFMFTFVLVMFLVLVNYVLVEKNMESREEKSSYECGFEHNSLSRLPFSIRYFLLTIIFLVFDVEVMLLVFVPSYIIYSFSYLSLLMVCLFILVLFLGLLYEYIDGSLDWVM